MSSSPVPPWQPTPVPDRLTDEVGRAVEALSGALNEAGVPWPEIARDAAWTRQFTRLLACSPFALATLLRHPEWVAALGCAGGAEDDVPTFDPAASEATLMAVLRQHRARRMLTIVWRALEGAHELTRVLSDTSALADRCLRLAVASAQQQLVARHGTPRDAYGRPMELITLAMGKLGGRELNFSSDIDVVFLYRGQGTTDGARALSHEEFFTRVAQRVTRYLDERTADGFVFRVDTRLRPFGASGRPVHSLAALEDYLQAHARAWERYAYARARPVTGSEEDGKLVLDLLRPFVFRRYLDYSVLASVRDIRERISAESRRLDRRDDLKLGAGGIREIEFVVQTFQVLYGGRDRHLRRPSTLAALEVVEQRGLISPASAQALRSAYALLRRTENAVQMLRDEQTHSLPARETDRARLAVHLAFEDWAALAGALGEARSQVVSEFAAAVLGNDGGPTVGADLNSVVSGELRGEGAIACLDATGLARADEVATMVESLREATWYRRLTAMARERLDDLLPRLLQQSARASADPPTVRRVLRVLEAVGSRGVYYTLLIENPAALERLVRVCQLGPVVADRLAHTPALIDEMLDPALLSEVPTESDLGDDLERRLHALEPDDEEAHLDALRSFQHSAVFQIAVSDLLGLLSVSRVSDLLTVVAERLLQRALAAARRQLGQRYGHARNGDGEAMRFAVLAYGKLGGRELAYGSDLDLVFLHDDGGGRTDGAHALEAPVYFIRLAQRLIHILSTQTSAGVLYEVDTRLRPSGNSGLLVTSLNAFTTYQREQAWTWEHQALLRARAVAGDGGLCDDVEAVRRQILCQRRERDALRTAVLEMRERMRGSAGAAAADPQTFDVKGDTGGLVDLEFLVQYLVLAHAHEHPSLVVVQDNAAQLRQLADVGVIESATAQALADAYYALRGLAHRATLAGQERALRAREEAQAHARVIAEAFATAFGPLEG